MSTARRLHYSYADYLQTLKDSVIKLEFYEGSIYAMAGGTLTHAQLSMKMGAILLGRLPSSCKVFSSDAKVLVEATGLATFPDVSVVCGDARGSPIDKDALTNPTLLVEVTSRSTEDYDRSEKLSQYKQIPSLSAVLFVSHRSRRITVVSRDSTHLWSEREVRAGEHFELKTLGLMISVDDLYQDIPLENSRED